MKDALKKDLSHWNASEIMKLYGIKSKTALLTAEKNGRIPEAIRDAKNNRSWQKKDLPSIGTLYGPLHKPDDWKFVSVCIFTVKGGVTKTTKTYSLARLFALCGFRVLIVGNDPQCSITGVTLNPLIKHKSINDLPKYQDLGSVIFENVPLEDVVQKTDIPTLDLLPETKSLGAVADHMALMAGLKAAQGQEDDDDKSRHKYYADKLNPLIEAAGYDIAFYDNGPGLNALSENALYASDYWITPNACDQGSYQVFEDNFNDVLKFAARKKKSWKRIFLIPTALANNSLSKQIRGAFMQKFPDYVTKSTTRATVKAQEALTIGASPVEVYLNSDIGQDYLDLAQEIWGEMMRLEEGSEHGN